MQHNIMTFLKVSIFLLKDPDFEIVLIIQNSAIEVMLETSKS